MLSLTLEDLQRVEHKIGHALPDAFKQHYLRCNGGIPAKTFFPGDEKWEPVEVAQFFPVCYHPADSDNSKELLENRYSFMVGKEVIPSWLLPFANDHGGNFFCLDLQSGNVCFYATDSFNPRLSMVKNHAAAQRVLSQNFESFLAALTTEEKAYG